ncbi:MAG: glycerol kinase GlpK [Ruminococcaceae bacterium]|nr:glycerol kinase GlpK [Oscillospiraceae bacterium]
MKEYLLALDQGTTSSRCIIFDRQGKILSKVQREFAQIFPRDGWVEHDATEIWASQMGVAVEAMLALGATAEDIAAIGITNQRETVVVWERDTGRPICNAIVWQCRRTAAECDALKTSGVEPMIRERTGLLIDPYFSATKLCWILDHVDGARARAERGELLFGTIDTWLIYRLTDGKVHATDPSNAARTMLFNIHTMSWDEELLRLFRIPAAMMPAVKPSSGLFGYTDPRLFGGEIPIAGVAGDQQAALFGQCCFDAGDVKNTYGTGGFLLMNTGAQPILPKQGLLATVGWQIGSEVRYVVEGSVFVCGAVMQWLRDGLGLLKNAADSERMAMKVSDSAGVYLVPAFVGLGAPYWDAYARGGIQGLTRATNKYHIVRAALESMAYQTADVLSAMQSEAGARLSALRVDGGASANNFLLQFQADILGIPLLRPACVETTAWGAATLAGLGVGVYSDTDELRRQWQADREFYPAMGAEQRADLLRGWHRAVERTMKWAEI